MNWFRQNRFLGNFLIALALATALSGYFLWHEKAAADESQAQLDSTVTELNRLRGSSPFPSAGNLQKTKAQTDSYRASLETLEDELKTRMFPRPAIQSNEFQAQLRQTAIAVIERARQSKVRLPENFNLGFDQYATSLPNSEAAPRLGRQLKAIEWIVNTIIEAHVDSLVTLTRSALVEEKATAAATPVPAKAAAKGRVPARPVERARIVDWTSVDISFAGSPAAVRKVLNQITSAREQFYIVRTLQVKNQMPKGPKRGGPPEVAAPAPVPSGRAGGAGRAAEQGISFIVGTEHLNVAARIEILKFDVPEKETR